MIKIKNTELANRVLDQVTRNPDTHDQSDFAQHNEKHFCGTQACLAGWAVILAGEAELVTRQATKVIDSGYRYSLVDAGYEVSEWEIKDEEGEFDWYNKACHVLGLDPSEPEVDNLFNFVIDESEAISIFTEWI